MTWPWRDVVSLWWAWMSAMSLQLAVLAVFVALLDRICGRWVGRRWLTAMWFLVVAKLLVPPTIESPYSVARWFPVTAHAVENHATVSHGRFVLAVFTVWAAGVTLSGVMVGARFARLRREWLGASTDRLPAWLNELVRLLAAKLGLKRLPPVRIRPGLSGPAVIGFVSPVIVLPAKWLRRAARTEVEHVLLHEMAHVRRRDSQVSLVIVALQIVYWFHPAVWLARVRLATLREIACDHAVLGILGESSDAYRRTLLGFARRLVDRSTPVIAAFLSGGSQLLARLDWLGRRTSENSMWRRLAAVSIFAGLAVCCVPLARPIRTAEFAGSAHDETWLAFEPPPLDQLDGCMQLRFAVMKMLARAEQSTVAYDLALNNSITEE